MLPDFLEIPSGPAKPGLGFALIGCGSAGKRRAYTLETGELRFACDPDLTRAQEIAREHLACRATPNEEEAILDPGVQVVIVSTPHTLLAPITLMAVRAGKHVLVEKPGAVRSSDLEEIQSATAETGSLVRVGFNLRYFPAFQKAYEITNSEGFGSPFFIRARYGHGGRLGFTKEWRTQVSLSGGGVLLDMGVHLIDLAASFMGDFCTVQGQAASYFWDMSVEDNVFLNLRTRDNRTAWLHASYTDWKKLFSFEMCFRGGKLHIEGGRSYGAGRLYYSRNRGGMESSETWVFESPQEDRSWAAEMAAFRKDIAQKRTPNPGLKEAIRTLEIAEEIYHQRDPLTDARYPFPAATAIAANEAEARERG